MPRRLCTEGDVQKECLLPIGKVWIYRLLFVCFFCNFVCMCNFVWLQISLPKINLVASNFFTAVHWHQKQGITHILENFAPPEAQNWTNLPARATHADPLAGKFIT